MKPIHIVGLVTIFAIANYYIIPFPQEWRLIGSILTAAPAAGLGVWLSRRRK